MLTEKENRELTQVGPGTPMGDLMRRAISFPAGEPRDAMAKMQEAVDTWNRREVP